MPHDSMPHDSMPHDHDMPHDQRTEQALLNSGTNLGGEVSHSGTSPKLLGSRIKQNPIWVERRSNAAPPKLGSNY
jgi:hypothetical protein